jgi:hypothetical protein
MYGRMLTGLVKVGQLSWRLVSNQITFFSAGKALGTSGKKIRCVITVYTAFLHGTANRRRGKSVATAVLLHLLLNLTRQ